MKKVLLSLAVLAAVVFALIKVSESDGRKEFLREIETQNKLCPIKQEWGEVLSVALKDSDLVYNMKLDENVYSNEYIEKFLKSSESNIQIASRYMSANMASNFWRSFSSKEQSKLKKCLSKYISNYRFDFYLQNSRALSLKVPSDSILCMIEECALNPEKVLRKSLQAKIELDNMIMPIQIDEGVKAQKMFLNNDDLFLVYSLDENIYDLDSFIENINRSKEETTKEFANDSNTKQLVELYKVNIVYRYMGDQTGKYVDIKVPAEEFGVIK